MLVKKGIVLAALLFLLVLCTFSMAAPADVSPLAGTYEGWYYATQGQTGLTLTVNEDGTGVFEFYNMPGRSNAKDGSYTIKATLEDGNYVIRGDEWIEKPSTYVFVTLEGPLNQDVYTAARSSTGSAPLPQAARPSGSQGKPSPIPTVM